MGAKYIERRLGESSSFFWIPTALIKLNEFYSKKLI